MAGPGEIVIDVTSALTCATDAKMMAAGAHPALGPLPAPLGHEVAGVVREAGEGVAWPRPGDAVVVANSAPCLDCPACRAGRPNLCRRITYLTGAFAERLRVPAAIVARNVHPLPTGLSPALGAAAEPLACAVHTVRGCGPARGAPACWCWAAACRGNSSPRLAARAGAAVTLLDPHPDRREHGGAQRRRARPAGARGGRRRGRARRGGRGRPRDRGRGAAGGLEDGRAPRPARRRGACSTAGARPVSRWRSRAGRFTIQSSRSVVPITTRRRPSPRPWRRSPSTRA